VVVGYIPAFRVDESTYDTDFGGLFSTDLASDVTVISDNGLEFKCHQSVLARAPVLNKMLKDIKEKPKKLKLSNIRDDIMEVLLRSLYTGQIIPPENSKKTMIKGDFVELVTHNLTKLGVEATLTSKEKGPSVRKFQSRRKIEICIQCRCY